MQNIDRVSPAQRYSLTFAAILTMALCLAGACSPPADPPLTTDDTLSAQVGEWTDAYLEQYLATFPTAATGAGDHRHDRELEDLSPERIAEWLSYNQRTVADLEAALATDLDLHSRLDAETLLRQSRQVVFRFGKLAIAETRPLFWSGLIANAPVFLLVRDDLPLATRLDSLGQRLGHLPRLAQQATAALVDPERIAPDHAAMAAHQVAASATFLRQGIPQAADAVADTADRQRLQQSLTEAGTRAATALDEFTSHLESIAAQATGDPRLGEHYAEAFRLGSGLDRPVAELLRQAQNDLIAKRAEVAAYCRSIWHEHIPGPMPPGDGLSDGSDGGDGGHPNDGDGNDGGEEADRQLVAQCFARIAEDGAGTVEDFVVQYKQLTLQAYDFVAEQGLVTLPGELTLVVDRSPSYFVGQAVGGVYPAGPYAPNADTFLFVPTPPSTATADQQAAFFRDFNDHFNVMITPHETVPGHYLQLKTAALQPWKIRSMFGNGVYTEGWGTFCERLMLDQGWGEPLDRVAHLKKQLENIARTIVDIRVHTEGIDRDEVIRLVRDEALQDAQFAGNMWVRAITSSPQLTTYYLGYSEIMSLYEAVRERDGDSFDLRQFMDGMLALGPVAVADYRQQFLSTKPAE